MRAELKEFKEFLKTVCIVSATMASISFVGVSILVLIYSPSGVTATGAWRDAAYFGVAAVFGFAIVSILTLIVLDPKIVRWESKKRVDQVREWMWGLLLLSWFFFLALIGGLFFTFI